MPKAPRRLSVAVAAVVVVVAVGLSWLASAVNATNNRRFLEQQVAEASTLLSTQVAVLQTQMADAGQVADATSGTPGPFTNFAAGTIAAPEMSLSLWRVTDGAVERRGEVIDTGLERLRSTAAAAAGQPLPTVLDRLMELPTVKGGRDDTVILGLRWTTSR